MTRYPLKKLFSYLLTLFLVVLFSFGCEKDDICVDGDTPLLVIVFRDTADTTLAKAVNSLRVIAVGNENPVTTITDRSPLDSIAIPLDLEAGFTEYVFIADSADENEMETGNPDTIRFTYTVTPDFVSRACGFVGRYEGVTIDVTPDTLNWIEETEIRIPDIIKQDSAHVAIFH